MISVDVMTDEVLRAITRMEATLEPRHFGYRYTNKLRDAWQDQIDESFANEGPQGTKWAGLSEWRMLERDDTGHPILDFSGSLKSEVKFWRGTVRLVTDGFTFNFPDTREMSGRQWGLFAGQMVNPLGAAPLAANPRPVLAGRDRIEKDSADRLVDYFRDEGWQADAS